LATDRDEVLRKAEKLLRTGKLDLAIAEYVRLVDEQPRDWNSRNTLGDLYVRANKPKEAVAQYTRIAEYLTSEDLPAKAAALYKKILRIVPDDESVQLKVGDLAARQGLTAEAKGHFAAVAAKRRARGDRAGAQEVAVRLASVDPSNFDARTMAARALVEQGDTKAAAAQFRSMHADLLTRGLNAEALVALREAVRYDGSDVQGRLALLEVDLRAGDIDAAREMLAPLMHEDGTVRQRIVELAWTLAPASPDAAYACIEAAADAEIAAGRYMDAAGILQEFSTRASNHLGALVKLVDVCIDGGLEAMMYDTQGHLADLYLDLGQPTEARVIAEDLVAREPWEPAHIDRFRRALLMLEVPDPDDVIAERLSGQGPFIATDPFAAPESFGDPEMPIARPPSTAAKRQPDAPSQDVDLTDALSELESLSKPGAPAPEGDEELDDVFKERRSELSRQAGVQEAAEQLELAQTYLDMGMTDEAIGALTVAAKIPTHRFAAASVLGRLYLKKKDPARAVEWLERAAEAPAPTPGEGYELLYDLGVTLDATGEVSRALAVFMELQADAGPYKDVPLRIERLSRVQTGG